MRKLNLCAVFTALIMIAMSCGRTKSSEANDTGDGSAPSAVSNGVEIEYSSVDAINAPAYDPNAEWGSPLALNDPLGSTMDGCPIVDDGAYSANADGIYPGDETKVYDIFLVNQSQDTITIKTLHLPDASFTVKWNGLQTYRPGVLSMFKLLCDSAVSVDDYRFVVTYEGDKYPPQVFHVNLRPDMWKMKEERESRNK